MAASIRSRMLRSLCSSLGSTPKPQLYINRDLLVPSHPYAGRKFSFKAVETQSAPALPFSLHKRRFGSDSALLLGGFALSHRAYSSSAGAGGGNDGSDLMNKIKDAWGSVADAVNYGGEKAKEASYGVTQYVHRVLDSYPYLEDVVAPISYTLFGTLLVWFVMPGIFKRIHKYAMGTRVAIASFGKVVVPYEKSFWGALEDPVRYLVTFIAFSQIGMLVVPDAATLFAGQVWRGAAIVSLVWFLHRWKRNWISRALASQTSAVIDRQTLLTLDNVSSIGLFVIGAMALAEACGVPVQSILTVGGIGGVATAFAARDILGNILSGLSMHFSKPFSVGDTIRAGSIEGQVVEMGLTSTLLLSAEKFPVVVPNSLFSSQVIVNKSRAQWRAIITKIPLTIESLDKVPQITNDIKSMLNAYKEAYCFLSRIESSFAELTIGYSLKHMSKEKLYSAEQDILLQSVEIIKKHGAKLGSSWQSASSQ